MRTARGVDFSYNSSIISRLKVMHDCPQGMATFSDSSCLLSTKASQSYTAMTSVLSSYNLLFGVVTPDFQKTTMEMATIQNFKTSKQKKNPTTVTLSTV